MFLQIPLFEQKQGRVSNYLTQSIPRPDKISFSKKQICKCIPATLIAPGKEEPTKTPIG